MSLAAGIRHAEALILDLEGTLYRGDLPIPGAAERLRRLRDAGLQLRFLTNTTSRGSRALALWLRELGFDARDDEVFCSPTAAAAFLRARQASAHLLVQPAALDDFEGVTLVDEDPDFVVLGDLGEGWRFDLLNSAFRMIHEQGAGLIGLVRSRYWLAEDGLRLDAGPFVVALEYATGVSARVFGKPEPAIFEAVLADLGLPASAVTMVGDDPQTDIAAARAVGLSTVLVRSGKYTGADPGAVGADLVIDSVADLEWPVPGG